MPTTHQPFTSHLRPGVRGRSDLHKDRKTTALHPGELKFAGQNVSKSVVIVTYVLYLLGGIPTYSYGTWTMEIKDSPIKMMDLSIVLGGSWWYTYPSESLSASVGIMTFPIDGKKEHVPNHQPGNECWMISALHP